MPAGRRLPVQHLPRGEEAGEARQREVLRHVLPAQPAGGGDRAVQAGDAGHAQVQRLDGDLRRRPAFPQQGDGGGWQREGAAQVVGQRLPPARRGEAARDLLRREVRAEVEGDGRAALGRHAVADGGREGVDGAALEAARGDHRLPAHGAAGEGERDALEGGAREAVAEVSGPGDQHAAIGGTEGREAQAPRCQEGHPGRVRPQPGPGGAAEREQRGVRGEMEGVRAGPVEGERALRRPAGPGVAAEQRHASGREAREEGAEQRRRLHGRGEDPAAGAGVGRLAEPLAPGADGLGREGADRRLQPGACGAVAGEEGLKGFGMGEVEAAAPGHQQLAGGAGHAVQHGDRDARLRENLRRRQPRGAGADDGYAAARQWRDLQAINDLARPAGS